MKKHDGFVRDWTMSNKVVKGPSNYPNGGPANDRNEDGATASLPAPAIPTQFKADLCEEPGGDTSRCQDLGRRLRLLHGMRPDPVGQDCARYATVGFRRLGVATPNSSIFSSVIAHSTARC